MLRADVAASTLAAFGETVPCVIGRGGAVAEDTKREGDGATPIGVWPITGFLLRPDRVQHRWGKLPWRWLRRDDGWSDDPADPGYNQPVLHPYPFSAERLWRDDGLYDVIVILAHNQAPAKPGMGSAIFLHCWNDRRPTEGCVAVEREALLRWLPLLAAGDALIVG